MLLLVNTNIISGLSVLEKLLSDPFIIIKAWRLGETLNEKQKQEHLVHMKRSSILNYVVICRRQNVESILEKVSKRKMKFMIKIDT